MEMKHTFVLQKWYKFEKCLVCRERFGGKMWKCIGMYNRFVDYADVTYVNNVQAVYHYRLSISVPREMRSRCNRIQVGRSAADPRRQCD